MELRKYFNIIKRWWWLLIIGMIIPMSVSYSFLSKQPALYQAKVTLMVGSAMQQPGYDPTLARASASLAQAYTVLVKRRPITQAVIQRLNLEKSPDELVGQITAWISPEAQLLEIMVTDTDPQAAYLIANALADELIRQSPTSVEGSQRQQAFVQEQLADLEIKIKNIEEEIRGVEDSLANLTSAAEIEEAQRRLTGLQEIVAGYRSTYASLLQSLVSSSVNILTVVEPAIEPTDPISSRSKLILLVAGATGLALALGAALVIEFLDDTLRWESYKDQLLLDLPVVGLMPKLPREDRRISTDVPLDSSEAEALRFLRANIFLAPSHRFISTILVASPGHREGRTSVVASMGGVIASGGRRVIIVDADLRTPTLHEIFGLPNDYGLCELLLAHAPSIEKALQETSVPNLYLLSAGKPPLDLTLALTSPRMTELIEVLREQASIIIFDSPPLLLAPDTAILSGLVEGTLLVVRDGHTTYKDALKVKERLSAYEGSPIIGVLFNRARLGGWALLPRRRRRPKPLLAPPLTRGEKLTPLATPASSVLEAVSSERDSDLSQEISPLIEQHFDGEMTEEWYPPLEQGVETESEEGLAVRSRMAGGEDRSQ